MAIDVNIYGHNYFTRSPDGTYSIEDDLKLVPFTPVVEKKPFVPEVLHTPMQLFSTYNLIDYYTQGVIRDLSTNIKRIIAARFAISRVWVLEDLIASVRKANIFPSLAHIPEADILLFMHNQRDIYFVPPYIIQGVRSVQEHIQIGAQVK